jgi:hypothetical protein
MRAVSEFRIGHATPRGTCLAVKNEHQLIKDLFEDLCSQPKRPFPQFRQPLDAPAKHGVYIIRQGQMILHVGRTVRGQDGLHQRLHNHLHGSSSFTRKYLNGNGATLRKSGFTYQFLELEDARKRALLEAFAVGVLCPKHLGLGEEE